MTCSAFKSSFEISAVNYLAGRMFLNLSRPVSEGICRIVLEQYTASRLAAGCFSVAHFDLCPHRGRSWTARQFPYRDQY